MADALDDPNSIFYTYQKLISLRKAHEWIVYGDYELLETSENVFAYLRKYAGETYLVVVNFSDEHEEFSSEFVKSSEIIANVAFPETLTHVKLAPWDAFVVGVS